MNYCCYQVTLRVKHFYTNQRRCYLEIYHCCADLDLTGRIHDRVQSVLKSPFQIGSRSSSRYLQICFLIAFLDDVLIRNMIRLRSNYTVIIIIFNNNNNAIINNNNLYKALGYYFVLQNFQGHAKEFLRNLQTIWA